MSGPIRFELGLSGWRWVDRHVRYPMSQTAPDIAMSCDAFVTASNGGPHEDARRAAMTDAEILAAIAPAADDRWRRLFGMPLWSNPVGAADEVVDALVQLLYELDVGVSFDWMTWYWPGRYPGGEGPAGTGRGFRPDARVIPSRGQGGRRCRPVRSRRRVDPGVDQPTVGLVSRSAGLATTPRSSIMPSTRMTAPTSGRTNGAGPPVARCAGSA